MGKTTKHLVVRIPAGDYSFLHKVCQRRGEQVSDFVRRTVRTELAKLSYLDDASKKALGVEAAK